MTVDGGRTPDQQDAIPRAELKRRAAAGVLIVSTRGMVILLVGFAGNLALARLLTPSDFGVVAIGMSFVVFAQLVSDGGLGAGLIRRPEPPSRSELGALTALQLGVTVTAVLLAVAVAAPLGNRVGWTVAVMVASMPLVALQFPGRILLERALLYRRLAVVEVTQVVGFYAWALVTVIAGFGVWGLATATVVRAAIGTGAVAVACPGSLMRPVWSIRLIRPLVGFGLRFQAVNATWLVGTEALSVSVAAISGVAALGLWSLVRRVMELPRQVLMALWRVSFPTMSRLVAAKEDVSHLVERAVGMAAVGLCFVLTGLVGAAPGLIPGLFGEQWQPATVIFPGVCFGLALSGPVSVATQGYLYAVEDAGAVLRSALLHTALWFAVTLPLLPVIGVASIGMGGVAAGVGEVTVLVRATARRLRARLLRPLLAPLGVGVVSASFGWYLGRRWGEHLLSGILSGGCAMGLFVVGLAVLRRQLLRDTLRFAALTVRSAASGRRSDG